MLHSRSDDQICESTDCLIYRQTKGGVFVNEAYSTVSSYIYAKLYELIGYAHHE